MKVQWDVEDELTDEEWLALVGEQARVAKRDAARNKRRHGPRRHSDFRHQHNAERNRRARSG